MTNTATSCIKAAPSVWLFDIKKIMWYNNLERIYNNNQQNISPLNLLWETMKTAQAVKNYFNLNELDLLTEKILDYLLARFQTLQIEGLREDTGSNKKLVLKPLKSGWQAIGFGPKS